MFKGLRLRATWRGQSTSKRYAAVATPVMISKCANPHCSTTLMRLDGGKFFGFPGKNNAIEHFWLCGKCAQHFTLRLIEGRVEMLRRDRKSA